jgi:hypothetical protein
VTIFFVFGVGVRFVCGLCAVRGFCGGVLGVCDGSEGRVCVEVCNAGFCFVLFCFVFAVFVGFEEVWASVAGKRGLRVLAIPRGIVALYCVMARIAGNGMKVKFIRSVLEEEVVY